MNLSKKVSLFLNFILVTVALSCDSDNEQEFEAAYYENSEQQWVQTLSELGFEEDTLQHHVLLVVQTTSCTPCLQELDWWNTEG